MADNKDRLADFEKLVGKEKAAEVLETAKGLSEKAEKFLASKEAKPEVEEEKKPKGKKEDDKEEDATKEFKETLVAMKEAQEKGFAELKETLTAQTEKSDKAIAELTEKNLQLQKDMAEVQKYSAALLGVQPKSAARGFKASEQGDEPQMDKEMQDKANKTEKAVRTGDDFLGAITDFVISGTRADAA